MGWRGEARASAGAALQRCRHLLGTAVAESSPVGAEESGRPLTRFARSPSRGRPALRDGVRYEAACVVRLRGKALPLQVTSGAKGSRVLDRHNSRDGRPRRNARTGTGRPAGRQSVIATRDSPGRFLSTGQVSRLCGVSPVTVAKWVDRGALRGHVTPGGHRRITTADLARFLKQYRMSVPPELESDPVQRVVVADPDDRFQESLKIAVESVSPGCQYWGVASGTQALVLVGSWRPNVILLGLGLGDVDPLEVCRWLSDMPESPVRVMAVVTTELDERTTMGTDVHVPVVLVPRARILESPAAFLQELLQISLNGSTVHRSSLQ